MPRENILVRGIVQGVGFRPHVYHLALKYSLSGWVLNDSRGVEIEVEGRAGDIESFVESLENGAPRLATITSLKRNPIPSLGEKAFKIVKSRSDHEKTALVPPDSDTCDDCLRELFDPADRRHRYPFISCTNCGPRYTMISDIPYDRPFTSMSAFTMCPRCQREYDDPSDRRFHAQPNACWECGPSVAFLDASGKSLAARDEAIRQAAQHLKAGKIVAIKGLGGFHLAVDAANEKAVARLRERKYREAKPLAIMSPSLNEIRTFCRLSQAHVRLLTSARRPIVLCPKPPQGPIAENVAPRSPYLGVMLPYTPLHHLLLREGFAALVMTSGNQTDEPIAIDNDEALRRLGTIADAFLVHNPHILTRADDTVVAVMSGRPVMLRRSRGYAPAPVELPAPASKHILAVGAEQKNTICFVKNDYAFPGQHVGDLDNPLALQFFEHVVAHLGKLLDADPAIIAHDLHPAYMSTAYARKRRNLKLLAVQHHHAHIASCMAEHSLDGRAIGLTFDGTGYGTDGKTWGSELLIASLGDCERLGSLAPTPMPGGDRCVDHPDRMAFSFLFSAYGSDAADLDLNCMKRIPAPDRSSLAQMLEKNVNSPLSSGMGRLFDAVSALLNICPSPSFDGQPAMELEYFAVAGESSAYPLELSAAPPFTSDPSPLIRAVVRDIRSGVPREVIAARFHNSICQLGLDMALAARRVTGLDRVVLSGGVFQNTYLTEKLLEELSSRDFRVYIHKMVPPNDGGISLGQAVVAWKRMSV